MVCSFNVVGSCMNPLPHPVIRNLIVLAKTGNLPDLIPINFPTICSLWTGYLGTLLRRESSFEDTRLSIKEIQTFFGKQFISQHSRSCSMSVGKMLYTILDGRVLIHITALFITFH